MALFKKDMEPSCTYCACGIRVTKELVACEHWGVVGVEESCRHFQYDPLKRIPARPKKIPTKNFRAEDFKL